MSNKRQKVTESKPVDREDHAADDGNVQEQRFAWLLAPIRDLAQNWDIDIAQELEKYLAELGHVVISLDNGEEGRKMNFAEAALLLQGSISVYSKKVEYLYQLCFELVQLFARQRAVRDHQPQESSVNNDGHDQDADSLLRFAAEFDEDFLHLDDIQECRNIDLIENQNDGSIFTNAATRVGLVRPPMPLSLVPLEAFEKSQLPLVSSSGQVVGRRDDFWMNTSRIHPTTGTLLLDACNAALINAPTSTDTFAPCANDQSFGGLNLDAGSPPAGAGPSQCSPDAPKDPQQRAQEQLPHAETTFGAADDSYNDFGQNDSAVGFDPLTQAAITVSVPPPPPPEFENNEQSNRFGLLPASNKPSKMNKKTRKEALEELRANPWQEIDWIDEDDEATAGDNFGDLHDKPLRKGRTYRVPSVGVSSNSEVVLLEQPVNDYLNECVYKRPRKLPNVPWKRPSSHALDDIYWSERKRRMATQRQRLFGNEDEAANNGPLLENPQNRERRQSEVDREEEEREQNLSRNLHLLFDANDGDDNDNYDDDADDGGDAELDENHDNGDLPDAGDDGYIEILGLAANEPDNNNVSSVRPNEPNADITSVTTYEDLVRVRLEQIMREAENNIVLGDLTRRVQEWEARIEPALREDESRHRFDVHEYGDDLIAFFDQAASGGPSESGASYNFVTFSKTKGQWETCRYFLSSLMLANTGNVQLSTTGEEGELGCADTLTLTLLSRERHHEQLEEYAAPSSRATLTLSQL